METVCELNNISKAYNDRTVLKKFSLTVNKGELLGISGASGKGKSTLLNMMGLLDKPDSGDVLLFGKKNLKISSKEAMLLLRYKIFYLFQNFALIDDKSIDYNLDIALSYDPEEKVEKNKKKEEALSEVGIHMDRKRKVYSLSGGEQQRVALARGILKPCELILADEPTGSVDQKNRDIILEILKRLNESGKTIVIVSHDPNVMDKCDRVIEL
jgi:putative ABC transport system ATP-binding protein